MVRDTHERVYTIRFHLNNSKIQDKLKSQSLFLSEVWEGLREGKPFLSEIMHAYCFKLLRIMVFCYTMVDN